MDSWWVVFAESLRVRAANQIQQLKAREGRWGRLAVRMGLHRAGAYGQLAVTTFGLDSATLPETGAPAMKAFILEVRAAEDASDGRGREACAGRR